MRVFLNKSSYAIDPKWPSARRWDSLMIALLLYTAIFTPYEVAFLETELNWLFIWNRFVDLSFTIDIVINFFLIVQSKETGEPVADLPSIALVYLQGWFTVDLVSVFPFDVISIITTGSHPDAGESLSSLKILRIVRLARLIKLLRILRASRLLNRYESSLGLSFSWISISKCSIGMLVIAHWLACAFHLVPGFLESPPDENWIFVKGIQDEGPMSRYLYSLYWSITTVTTVGYGDITPQSDLEVFWCTVFMTIGGIFYAYVMGNICGIVSTLDEAGNLYKRTMDVLNLYMDDVKLPYAERMQLREYFMHCRGLQRSKFYKEVLAQMSPGLQGKFAIHCYGSWINRVYFLRALSENREETFVQRIALALEMEAYPPSEAIITTGESTTRMYIIKRGICARLGRVLTKGSCFGEDVILSASTPRHYEVRSLTYVDVHMLRKTSLDVIINNGEFPLRKAIVRRATIKLALLRGVVAIAKAYREHKNQGRGWDVTRKDVMLEMSEQRKRVQGARSSKHQLDDYQEKMQANAKDSATLAAKLLAKMSDLQRQHVESTAALNGRLSRLEQALSV